MTELHITLGMTREQFDKDERLCSAVDAAVAALDADPTSENKARLKTRCPKTHPTGCPKGTDCSGVGIGKTVPITKQSRFTSNRRNNHDYPSKTSSASSRETRNLSERRLWLA